MKTVREYEGFEQGPIRPPSEAASLLIRVSRNCPWNRCTFCPVYKGETFSLRPVEDVMRDIDAVARYAIPLHGVIETNGRVTRADLEAVQATVRGGEIHAFQAAANWARGRMTSVFLQDANSLIVKPEDLIRVLEYMRSVFLWNYRITSYARSHTVARISDEHLARMAEAGLNRIHIGMESGSDAVLKRVKKGSTKAMHIQGGLKVKKAGMELSEYVMPGLGGKELSRDHALETADALTQINPDFIRLRTLAIPGHTELYTDWKEGRFEKITDVEAAEEILLFLESLGDITSTLTSDHILNLFQDVEGSFPVDREAMCDKIRAFLAMDPVEKMHYQVGRRLGLFHGIGGMKGSAHMKQVEATCRQYAITPDNVDEVITQLMTQFI
ncbi:radical SAM protein [Desulfoluna butyratoxydans]|uniref:Radical sam n=1 Tax=Desulfoluna butyratoxydans TaxID=231438 RepID=A0A4U8YQ62_9BACT|nr:radical SAM protein [Desulfoluna butyratoxydans]VFQ46405.1 radical sam [Desulfoluna butyratoxydans]